MSPYGVINIEEMLETARIRTGLSDFGPTDFREALEALVGAINREAAIRPESAEPLRERFINLLIQRLYFARDLAAHPEIMDEDLGSPAIILAFPRSGSTKLHRMLAATEDFQTLRFWSILKYARIPGLPDGGRARRIEETRAFEEWMYSVSPGMLTGHPMHAMEPEEEGYLLECTFRHITVSGMFDTPSYMQWLLQADMDPTYDYLIAILKYLQWQTPETRNLPWLFKDPSHLGTEDRLRRIYKNPKFIMIHRDPVKCIPSLVRTVMATRQLYSDLDNSKAFGELIASALGQMMDEHMDWRDRHPEVPVLDLSFRETVADALGTARKVYAYLDKPLTAKAAEGVVGWDERNPQHKHGKPTYSDETVAATEAAVRDAFGPYMRRFSNYL